MSKTKHLFVSYSRVDQARVQPFLEVFSQELKKRARGLQVWRDIDALQPGDTFAFTIERALRDAVGLLIFVSQRSMESAWVRRELDAILRLGDRPIFPVLLEPVDDLPSSISQYQWLDLSGVHDVAGLRLNATKLADAVVSTLPKFKNAPPLTERLTTQFADFVAASLRRIAEPPSPTERQQVNSSVFVVHGHDLDARNLICHYLVELDVEPVVLAKARGSSQFLLQKFFEVSNRASFAVVIVSADDFGAPLTQYDSPGVGDRALQFRARQNVILELGFFYGRLGWENVFVLQKPAPRVFPNFERPSDLDGAVFEYIDDDGIWKGELAQRLARAGLRVDQAAIKGV